MSDSVDLSQAVVGQPCKFKTALGYGEVPYDVLGGYCPQIGDKVVRTMFPHEKPMLVRTVQVGSGGKLLVSPDNEHPIIAWVEASRCRLVVPADAASRSVALLPPDCEPLPASPASSEPGAVIDAAREMLAMLREIIQYAPTEEPEDWSNCGNIDDERKNAVDQEDWRLAQKIRPLIARVEQLLIPTEPPDPTRATFNRLADLLASGEREAAYRVFSEAKGGGA